MRQIRKPSSTVSQTAHLQRETVGHHVQRTLLLSSLLCLLISLNSLTRFSQTVIETPALFFAFGLVVMAAWLYNWKSVPYMLPGVFLYSALMYRTLNPSADPLSLYAVSTIAVAPLSFTTMRWAGISTEPSLNSRVKMWRLIILGGIKASIFAFVARSGIQYVTSHTPFWEGLNPFVVHFPVSFAFEMIGLVSFMLGVMILLKLTRPNM